MMGARVNLASGAAGSLAKAAVIAARYNLVRKQGFKDTVAGQSFQAPEHQVPVAQVSNSDANSGHCAHMLMCPPSNVSCSVPATLDDQIIDYGMNRYR